MFIFIPGVWKGMISILDIKHLEIPNDDSFIDIVKVNAEHYKIVVDCKSYINTA